MIQEGSAPEVREISTFVSGGVGDSAPRLDGIAKVTGAFRFASDLRHPAMLYGFTVRSPHSHGRIHSIDISAACAVQGVRAVLTHVDVPGKNLFGVERADQPVLAEDLVRYQGEPVALIAANDLESAKLAASLVDVSYEVLRPITDPEYAMRSGTPALHVGGNLVRHRTLRVGDPAISAEVMVSGEYSVGMQDPAFLGTEAALAIPDMDGGVDLHTATQWLHSDQGQICACLELPPEKVRLRLAGVGGAFGGREDLSLQVHCCMLALRTGMPVKMTYSRRESFYGHMHRHPARMRYEHGFRGDGRLVFVRAKLVFDGGAYASSTPELVGNVCLLGVGPYEVPNVLVDCYGVYTNNPPCGAMRGFGAVQAAFACESQMDKASEVLGLDAVEIRIRNALRQGSTMPTGQVLDSPAPVAELLERVRDMPTSRGAKTRAGNSESAWQSSLRRGVGYAVGFKSVAFSEGFDDYSTAKVKLENVSGEPTATVYTAASEVGQGVLNVEAQICQTELSVNRIIIAPKDTSIGSSGPSSASRQTYVTGGAVKAACEILRERILELAHARLGVAKSELTLVDKRIVSKISDDSLYLSDLLGDGLVIEEKVVWRHRPTYAVDPQTGQGVAHVQYAFAAHRAVVEVDVELGVVTVLELDCAQDVGKAINPQAVEGQIHGATAQGLGLAVLEEIELSEAKICNGSFGGYLVPTAVDVPPIHVSVLEFPDPHAPYGLRGVGEPPTISSTPAIVAAIRAATGRELSRVPVRPEDITSDDDGDDCPEKTSGDRSGLGELPDDKGSSC